LMLQGFAEQDDIPEEQVAVLSANPWPEAFFGLWESFRVAAAAMDVDAGLATFIGDAAVVRARGRGLQLALIRHRLQRAAQLGCDLASASVLPGSSSNRNYERAGFQMIYARIKVSRALQR
jgi:GNAT superfamily N-acetyltransferase